MNPIFAFRGCTLGVALAFAGCVAAQAKVNGDYVESRSADVYTGQCFANGEVGLSGDQAILAWHIQSGKWDDVKLDGLSVVAVVNSDVTLGVAGERGERGQRAGGDPGPNRTSRQRVSEGR